MATRRMFALLAGATALIVWSLAYFVWPRISFDDGPFLALPFTETAKILEIKIDGIRGYLIQKWPNMTYSVRTEIELNANGIAYTNRFQNKDDLSRYGMIERATLRRVQFSNPALQGTPASGRP